MKGLILNRSKYIVARSKVQTAFGIFCFIANTLMFVALAAAIVGAGARGSGSRKTNYSTNYLTKSYSYSGATGYTSSSATVVEEQPTVAQVQESSPTVVRNNIPETYLVTKIVDGDTIYVAGISTRIRLVGVNTPETVKSDTPVQCYGPEASNYLKELLLGKYVGLEIDAASGAMDIYNRQLRYVYLNGENVSQKIILGGYGKEASYGNDYKYRQQFLEAEEYARTNKIGLWSPDTCNGQE